MRKLLLFITLFTTIQANAQWPWEKVEGNGRLQKQTRQAGQYNAVHSSGPWNVVISYGEPGSIQVEGDENLVPYIETKVEDGKLMIRTTKHVNLRSKNKITIHLSLTRVTGLALSGSGDLTGNGKFHNDGNTYFRVSGSGTMSFGFDRVTSAEVMVSGSGDIRLTGASSSVSARVSGSGNADCSELQADNVTAHVSGSGNVKVNASKMLDATVSGSGNISNRGSATDIRKHVSGSGRVTSGGN
jgi:hypothetical protein